MQEIRHKFYIAGITVAQFMSQLKQTEPDINSYRDELILIVDFVSSDTVPFLQTSFLRFRDILVLLLDTDKEAYSGEICMLERLSKDELFDSSSYKFLLHLPVLIKEKDIIY